ncbi:MAG: hypothetical protein WC312_08195 [Candidatus Omnitrophota bacterium]
MKINKMLIISAIVLMSFAGNGLLKGETGTHDYAGENILYLISPFGRVEYNDLGVVELEGIKANLIKFEAKVLFFHDTEKIYSDPESLLPYKVERDISGIGGKEYIIEEYDQEKFIVTIRKFKSGKQVSEQVIKANEPIQNVILLPLYLRKRSDLEIGWRFTAKVVPAEFELELVSIDEIKVPAGRFHAYHFKSIPDKFEIWINRDTPRVPLRIKGKGYYLLMKKYSSHTD